MNKTLYNDSELESWAEVVGYDGKYYISNLGRVASRQWNKYRILRQRVGKKGYCRVNLSKDGTLKTFKVHRLVAKHFLPNPLRLTEINHKDENKSNNRVDNLEWCTRSYNVNYGTGVARRTPKLYKSVAQYSKDGEFIANYHSLTEASHTVGLSVQHIAACCKGKYPYAGGFVWRYLTEVRDAYQ